MRIRPRTRGGVSVLVEVLAEQQAASQLVVRETEEAAWVAEVDDAVVGHDRHRGWVEVGRLRPDWLPVGEEDLVLMTVPAPCG